MGIVDNAVYVDGRRLAVPTSLDSTYELMRERDGMAWIGLYRPTREEIESVGDEFSFHALAMEDTIKAHQRPKIERYDGVLFTVLRPARYVDDREQVEFGEVHVFTGPDFVVTVRHAESPDLGRVRGRLEANEELLRLGPEAVLYAILDEVVDEYLPVVDGLENDIDEIELQVFEGDPAVSRRIYQLLREVIEFQRATQPLVEMTRRLAGGFEKYKVEPELQRSLRDVEDHAIKVVERVDAFRVLLESILTVNVTLVGQRQNEDVKRISSWAAILFAPTLVASIYGMNFDHMPELGWVLGYPMSLAMMLAMGVVLYLVFKKRGWI
ncbi:MAG TPA: magnesium/cobalt transporter CorA [Nocardioidaceae bacterium]|nr:magnesium/cobalt transporter CorA [Nocardioidaceae bacterium]